MFWYGICYDFNDVIVQSGKTVTFNVKFPFKSGIEKKGLNQSVTEIENHKLETADEPGNLVQSGDLFAGEIPMIKGSKIIKEMSCDANGKLDFEVNAGIEYKLRGR